jgi:hypothetical protein
LGFAQGQIKARQARRRVLGRAAGWEATGLLRYKSPADRRLENPLVARSPDKTSRAGDDRRQKLWRELALVAVAPLLFYLLVSLYT